MRQDGRAKSLLGDRRTTVAVYETIHQTMPLLGAVAEKLLPRDMHFALLPAYSARRTARNLAAANLSPELLARTRIYSWCEFDGLMYLLQNECDGIYRCIDQAAGEGGQGAAELVCNHWRTSENELSLGYLAAGAFGAVSPQDFYKSFLGALAGQKSEPRLAKALSELDEATVFAVENLFNLGFCALGCWSLRNIWWTPQNIEKYKTTLGKIARQIAGEAPRVLRRRARTAARCGSTAWRPRRCIATSCCTSAPCTNWWTGMRASWCHRIRPFTRASCPQSTASGSFATPRRPGNWPRSTSRFAHALPDRMSEGTLTSYEYVMYGLLDKSLAEFAGVEAPASQGQAAAGPPSPIG